ncbi:hypothetical protein NIES2135_54360 [Leptolyngbya boryana NIES-2135]|jgi:hypothetical protein|uniref:Uncharacterized protein n=1 Tax=Leptolyngbya boryana NIES-2135 TaxID=1973484 RepID=A0A1Z4JPH6_LEPBY|nr:MULTISPECIES: hypothetical protein [Leptolyngbya]BAY58563.1 hypothetical protein NIES2135_54360 [Leptolyngbya boryana NIES-2135]MBD2370761.1 hypothetical protein [Leptolyngbya sp. FACHB-161]MBD2377086.1 hypothetical protein [Leptolyngbya sp. FACHB-238]MBD2401529.1 hypothetical protein [Leptolyngbya sp. FACHB-239]MBD2408081.1 hypothetical protein [Leptolyngbya sp. FACHB-402]
MEIWFWILVFGGFSFLYDLSSRYFTHRERMVKLQIDLENKKRLAAQAEIEATQRTIEVEDLRLQKRIERLP